MEEPHRFGFGPFQLDCRDERLWRGTDVIRVKPKALAVLQCLLKSAGRLVTKERLFITVWPETSVSDAVLTTTIRELRRALGDQVRIPHYIETVHGRGYRFIAPVNVLPHGPAASLDATVIPDDKLDSAAFPDGDIPVATTAPLTGAAHPHQGDIASTAATSILAAERRQLTVMSCDLVDSELLAEILDLEDLHELLRSCQAACVRLIEHFEGYIAQYLGHGLLVYFGHPQAHEDDARRAVRAGLDMLAAVDLLNARFEPRHGVRLAMRVGLHTGFVIVEDRQHRGGQGWLTLGAVPDIAVRLQERATPNTLVVSAATHSLIQGYFGVDNLGMQTLPGVSNPVQVFRVLKESAVLNRVEVSAGRGLTPFVGREAEIALLQDRWASVKMGHGQVVAISGEPGIGKTRLVQVVKDRVVGGDAIQLECRSSPYDQHSALYPVVDLMSRLLEWQAHEPPETKLEKLQRRLARFRLPVEETVPLFATLLSLPLPADRYVPLPLTPERQRQKLLDTMVSHVLEHAEHQPVLFILEDLHWTDPSTLEFLDLLIEQAPTAPILLLLTCRWEFQLPWGLRPYLTPLPLNRLARAEIELMISRITGSTALPATLIAQLVAKTDGVPLFIEEMTKAVLESGLPQAPNGLDTMSELAAAEMIPTTLQDSLMSRLDKLGTAKRMAQLGATIGRQFSYELLQAIAPVDEATLHTELGRLVEAELLYRRGQEREATYTFKHALIQDAAYQSLLKRHRQQVHQHIAQALEAQFPEVTAAQPELLAHHLTEAGLHAQAVVFWQLAGEKAFQRSAHAEAIVHHKKGLELLKILPDTPERTLQEVIFQRNLGVSLLATKGLAAPEVEVVYGRARELCQRVGDASHIFPVLFGLWGFYIARSDLQASRELATDIFQLAQRHDNSAWLLQGQRALGTTLFYAGELNQALTHLEQGIALYDPHQHRAHTFLYGQDPGVACLSYGALAEWLLGYPERARHMGHQALRQAQALSHPFSLAMTLFWSAWLHQLYPEAPITRDRAEALVALTQEQGFAQYAASSAIMQGWVMVTQHRDPAGVVQIRHSIDAYQNTGARATQTYFLSLLAEAYGSVGDPESGLATLAEALDTVETNGEHVYEAELHRLKGALRLQQSIGHQAEAEACFQQALKVARRQQAKSLELRAAISLSQLWQQQGKCDAAHALLATIYSWFTEGFDTPDLKQAKMLLDILAR